MGGFFTTESQRNGERTEMNVRKSNIFAKEDVSRDPLSEKIIGAAIEVPRALGPGLLESAYRDCLEYEIRESGLAAVREMPLPIRYKKLSLKVAYKLDLVVEGQVIVELKAVDEILWIHEAQLLTYLKLSGIRRGLLLNFSVPLLKDGIKRMVY
jgi:GxxExxY protein